MPKTDIDYSTTIIYKITCKSPDVNEVYVGHTTNFVQRKYAHKQSCINNKTTNYNCKLYQMIRKHNGWDNWNMEIVNFFNCKDGYEARQKEQEYFVLLKATLNSIEPLSKPKPNNVTINVKKCKEKKIYFCEHCKTRCSNEDTFNKHNETRKHKKIISGQKTLTEAVHTKNSNIFVCEKCDFKCCRKTEYKRHLETIKHKRVTKSNKKTPKDESNTFVCICGKTYKYRPGLAKHKRTCVAVNTSMETTIPVLEIKETEIYKKMHEHIDNKTDKELKDLVKELIKQNSELVKTINEIVPKIGTTNNITNNNTNFNLNVFLNEKCKDALNISDFIESLKITLEDLDFSNKNGMVRGISNLMIKGLKELDIHKRPIHCTDAKRDIIYIKDKEKWEKDDNHSKIKNTIVKVANKERNSLYLWVEKNPNWFDTEATQIEYLTMMRNICEPVEDFEKNEKKIIKNIGREVTLDKSVM
jgi:hypothetical protein